MVLAAAGIEKTEEELRIVSNCDAEGTWPSEIVKTAKSLGFENSQRGPRDFDELKAALAEGIYPITYIKVRIGATGYFQTHAVIVTEITPGKVFLLDPERGEIEVLESDFLREWSAANHETILVK